MGEGVIAGVLSMWYQMAHVSHHLMICHLKKVMMFDAVYDDGE